MVDPLQALTSAQRKALGLVQETFEGIIHLSRTGLTQPEEALRRLTELVAAVGDLAASTTKPMEALLTSQRNLANAMTAFATLQKEMAEVVEMVAEQHTAVVDALDKLASPVLAASEMIRSEPVKPRERKP